MSGAIEERAAALGAAAVRRTRARVAAAVRERLAGVVLDESDDGVAVSGRGVGERLLDGGVLRWVAGVVR